MQALHSPVEAAKWLRERVTGTLCADSRQLARETALLPGLARRSMRANSFVTQALGARAHWPAWWSAKAWTPLV
jgi:hypothetical protein